MVRLTQPITVDDHSIGPEDAAVTLVEYGTYDCPHCRQALAITLELLKEAHVSVPSLRLVYRHFPHVNGRSPAQRAAQAAEAAAEQGRFWEMHEHLLKNPRALDDASLLAYAAQLGLSVRQIAAALENDAHYDAVRSDVQGGVESGVRTTPTFFINGVRHDGEWDLDTLRAAICSAVE